MLTLSQWIYLVKRPMLGAKNTLKIPKMFGRNCYWASSEGF